LCCKNYISRVKIIIKNYADDDDNEADDDDDDIQLTKDQIN